MFKKKARQEKLNENLDKLNYVLTKNSIIELTELLGDRKRLLFTNIWAGVAKGIGIGIGVTIITAIIIFILQKIVSLNLPVIGEFIADIVEIVQHSLGK